MAEKECNAFTQRLMDGGSSTSYWIKFPGSTQEDLIREKKFDNTPPQEIRKISQKYNVSMFDLGALWKGEDSKRFVRVIDELEAYLFSELLNRNTHDKALKVLEQAKGRSFSQKAFLENRMKVRAGQIGSDKVAEYTGRFDIYSEHNKWRIRLIYLYLIKCMLTYEPNHSSKSSAKKNTEEELRFEISDRFPQVSIKVIGALQDVLKVITLYKIELDELKMFIESSFRKSF